MIRQVFHLLDYPETDIPLCLLSINNFSIEFLEDVLCKNVFWLLYIKLPTVLEHFIHIAHPILSTTSYYFLPSLYDWFSFTVSALDFFRSYLSIQTCYSKKSTSGLNLGSALFCVHVLPLSALIWILSLTLTWCVQVLFHLTRLMHSRYPGISQQTLSCLQLVQNAAARHSTGTIWTILHIFYPPEFF